MGKTNNAFQLLALTTGAGIAIGTDVDIGGIIIGSVASTVTIKAATVSQIEVVATTILPNIVGLMGPVTATSSGGSFSVLYRKRVV